MTAAEMARAAEFPPGVDKAQVLKPLMTRTWEVSSEYRRAVTRASPLLFANTYLGRYLRNSETGVISFSPWHLDAYANARTWVCPEPQRHVRVAPREGGKSILYFRGLPLWALAHGHRRFFTAFSNTGPQALAHLGNLLDILHGRAGETSRLILQDFPELTPIRGAGGPKITVLRGGLEGRRAIAAYGMHESSLGLNVDELRPDLLVGDDIEPGGDKWTPKTRAATITALTENILPMGRRAVVQVVGTVVAPGSVIHDAVKAAKGTSRSSWVTEAGFTPHWYPAIVDEGGPSERSLWPQQWPLEQLLRDRYNADGTLNRAFALTKMNDPVRDTGGAYWSGDFRYAPRTRSVRRWACWVDPAKSTHETSDYTAYVVAGLLSWQKPAVTIAVAEQGHWSPRETRQRLSVLRGRFPGLQVFVESNALGSEAAAVEQYGLIAGDQAPWAKAAKELRIRAAADVYAEELVVHEKPLPVLEDVLTSYGSGGRDDLPDALAGALGALLPGKIPG